VLIVFVFHLAVAPIPVFSLLPAAGTLKRPVLPVPLSQIAAIILVLVVVPIVVILVLTIVKAMSLIIVAAAFLMLGVLRHARGAQRGWGHQRSTKKNGSEKVSMSAMHIIFSNLKLCFGITRNAKSMEW
jgi:hypothetical protein